MEPELELQPESDLELEPSRMEIDALLEHPISDHTDTRVSNKRRYVNRRSKYSSGLNYQVVVCMYSCLHVSEKFTYTLGCHKKILCV